MLIDWFTICAQAINFLILVWLMKRYLYKPILDAINTREKRVAAELADADSKRAQAQKDRGEFQIKNAQFDKERAGLLSKATDEAKARRQQLLEEARLAADALTAKRQEALRREAHDINQAIGRRTRQEVFAVARKALMDLATTGLEERFGEVFTRRLSELDGPAKQSLASALKRAPGPATVSSAFDLPEKERQTIQNALNETFSADIHIRFQTAPDLVCGIELVADGQKVAWSIADYLGSLEKDLDDLLNKQDKSQATSTPKPQARPAPMLEALPAEKPQAKTVPATQVPEPATKTS